MLIASLLAAEAEAEAEGGATNPILPVVSELFWGALAFIALYLLVRNVFLPAAKRTMNDRAATIRADLDAAEVARSQAVSASSEVADDLAGARAEAAAIIEAARAEANAERERLLGRVEREVAAMRELAENDIATERAAALAALRPNVVELAADTASRIMSQQVSVAEAQPIVNRYLDNLN